jgi:hypothetical protein
VKKKKRKREEKKSRIPTHPKVFLLGLTGFKNKTDTVAYQAQKRKRKTIFGFLKKQALFVQKCFI